MNSRSCPGAFRNRETRLRSEAGGSRRRWPASSRVFWQTILQRVISVGHSCSQIFSARREQPAPTASAPILKRVFFLQGTAARTCGDALPCAEHGGDADCRDECDPPVIGVAATGKMKVRLVR